MHNNTIEGSAAPMQTDNKEVFSAAPASAALETEQEVKVPLKDSVASPPTKSTSAVESEGSAADKSDAACTTDEENKDTVATPTSKTAADDKDKEDAGEKTPVPALSSAAAASGEVDYANWDFEPPLANIRRLLKPILAKGTNISKYSVTTLSRAAGIFVLYLSNCATDIAREGKRSTIAGKDVMKAIKELDLEDFIPELEQFMVEHKKYQQTRKDEKDKSKLLKADAASSASGNKRGFRGSDGKYVVGAASTETKDDEKDDLNDDKPELELASQIISALSAKHSTEHEDRDENEVKKRKLEHDGESND